MPTPPRPWIGFLFGRDRFGVLLAILILAFLLPEVRGRGLSQLLIAGVNIASYAAGFSATGLRAHRRVTAASATIGIAGGVLVTSFSQPSFGASVGALCLATVSLVVLGAVVGRVLRHERVQLETIIGALAAYFLIGMLFAWIYLALAGFVDGPVLEPPAEGLPSYYSFVVLTTLGFGDITPEGTFVSKLTAIEAMTGQVFLATLVARLVSMYGQSRGSDTQQGPAG